MENLSNSDKTSKMKNSQIPGWTSRFFKWITNSAIVGLLLTLSIFVYEQYKSSMQTKDIVDNLVFVQKSLSTRYLGLFPEYLDRINEILDNAEPNDTIIIFEDVLYYGLISRPDEFKKMYKKIISSANQGSSVTIAYYNPKSRNFNRMVIDLYISSKYSAKMDIERRSLIKRHDGGNRISIKELRAKDSLICDKYFNLSRDEAQIEFRRSVDNNRRPLSNHTGRKRGLDYKLYQLYAGIDSIKSKWMAEDYNDLCLHDFENMYREITILLADELQTHGVELIPINENLSISCWLVGEKAILAFPSKYATDEIGFYSHDPAFSKYIRGMLNGFRGNYSMIDSVADSE